MARGRGRSNKRKTAAKATAKSLGSSTKSNVAQSSNKSVAAVGKKDFIQNAQAKAQKQNQTTDKGTGAKVTSRTSTSNVVVGKKTREAQQELSNKFGIVTFDTEGKISTTPSRESGGFSDINVGFGSFANAEVFRQGAIDFQVQKFAKENPQANENTAINVFDPLTPTRSFKPTESKEVFVDRFGRGQASFIETTDEGFTDKVSAKVADGILSRSFSRARVAAWAR